jgi:hypothetical protein
MSPERQVPNRADGRKIIWPDRQNSKFQLGVPLGLQRRRLDVGTVTYTFLAFSGK